MTQRLFDLSIGIVLGAATLALAGRTAAVRLPDYVKGPYWEPRDLWLGVFWNQEWLSSRFNQPKFRRTNVYVCVVPCFPVRLIWARLPRATAQPASEAER